MGAHPRPERATEHRHHPAMDGARGRARELLEDDGAEQRLERRLRLRTQLHAAGGFDDAPKRGVDSDEVRRGAVHATHGCAASTTAAAVGYSRLLRRRWPLFSIPVMMTSRLIVGVHYPSDVLAGALVGAVMGHWFAPARKVVRS